MLRLNKHILLILYLVCISTLTSFSEVANKAYDSTIGLLSNCLQPVESTDAINDMTIKSDSIDITCFMERTYPMEGGGFYRCQIQLNDTLSLFTAFTPFGSVTQATLTKQVADYLKSLLYEIYSGHKSVVKDKYINKICAIACITSKWNITMDMGEKRINESIDVMNYELSFDDPFHPQFNKILTIILAITDKLERDNLNLEYRHYEPEPWITEMFHDEYYEPYNEVKSHNYQ